MRGGKRRVQSFTLKVGMKHQLIATMFVMAFAATALSQQSGTPASQSPQDLPDTPQPTQAAMMQPNGPTVVMDTSMGRISCQFFQKQAPEAVATFIGLAKGTKDWVDPSTQKKMHGKRFYDGTTFHRVIPEFMIQGGDPTGTGMGDPGFSFNDELVKPELRCRGPPGHGERRAEHQWQPVFHYGAGIPHARPALHDLRTVR